MNIPNTCGDCQHCEDGIGSSKCWIMEGKDYVYPDLPPPANCPLMEMGERMKKADEERIERKWGLALNLAYRAWDAGLLSKTETSSSYSEHYLVEPSAEAIAILAQAIVTSGETARKD